MGVVGLRGVAVGAVQVGGGEETRRVALGGRLARERSHVVLYGSRPTYMYFVGTIAWMFYLLLNARRFRVEEIDSFSISTWFS